MKLRTIGMVTIGGLILFGLLYTTYKADPVPVSLHEVSRASMRVTIDADGKTQIKDVYEIATPISGTAMRAPVAVGDKVIADETVVAIVEAIAPSLLDQRSRLQAEAALKEAEAGLDVAQNDLTKSVKDLAYAQTQFNRVETLVDRGVSALTQLEDAAQQLAIAKASNAVAQSRLAMASGFLERAAAALLEPNEADEVSGECCISLRAPADGVVLDVDIISERPVIAGTRLLSLGDPTQLEIVADILSTDSVRVAPGTQAIVERWGGASPLRAVLRRIEPSANTKISALGIEEQRVDAIFDLLSPIEDRTALGHGFSVFLRIIEWQAEDVLQVPLSSAFRQGKDWMVFVVIDNSAVIRPIKLGRRNGRNAEVLSGLEPGELVIMHPSDKVTDGVAIIDRETL